MKLSAVVLALLLIASSCSRASSAPVGPDVPTCCSTYISHKLPRNLIRSHFSTSTSCSQPAVVFITKKKRAVCANPKDPWVRSYLQSTKQD